jgi:hypothetical protein
MTFTSFVSFNHDGIKRCFAVFWYCTWLQIHGKSHKLREADGWCEKYDHQFPLLLKWRTLFELDSATGNEKMWNRLEFLRLRVATRRELSFG